MPTFNDQNNIPPIVPEGDYVLAVTEFQIGLSKGNKTKGCEAYEVKFTVEDHGNTVYETLTDHPSCSWKIDTFLKSAGVKLTKGERFDFNKAVAESNGIRWVDPIGLRCHAKLFIERYNEKDRNKVATFYTDKPALARATPVTEEDIPFA
jgi:hypothetical protein